MANLRASGVRDANRARRVLIVEDNRDTAEIVAIAVSRDGHEVRVAHDAESAIRIATDFKPDVAFLDIGLPGIDGFDLALALRAIPQLQDCRLIAMTGYILPPHRAARPPLFNDLLMKPLNVRKLQSLVFSLDHFEMSPAGGH